jgi:hypothetical protein
LDHIVTLVWWWRKHCLQDLRFSQQVSEDSVYWDAMLCCWASSSKCHLQDPSWFCETSELRAQQHSVILKRTLLSKVIVGNWNPTVSLLASHCTDWAIPAVPSSKIRKKLKSFIQRTKIWAWAGIKSKMCVKNTITEILNLRLSATLHNGQLLWFDKEWIV